jgi:hypothetical protein
MARTPFIPNDPPYGSSERDYSGLRLARSLLAREGEGIKVFPIGDAAGGAKAGRKVPPGYHDALGGLCDGAPHEHGTSETRGATGSGGSAASGNE